MSRKSKGINAERDLIHKFWSNNLAAVRIAGSGSSKYPSPDLLVGDKTRKWAIECKTTKDQIKYFKEEEIAQIRLFSELFGAEPWVAVKFKGNDWLFLCLEDIKRSGKCYVVDSDLAKNKGLLIEELINKES